MVEQECGSTGSYVQRIDLGERSLIGESAFGSMLDSIDSLACAHVACEHRATNCIITWIG